MSRNIVVPNEEFFDNIVDELRVAGRVKLLVRGGSMFPFFRDSIDTVVLLELGEDEPLHRGGIYLFKSNGRYILHRLARVKHRKVVDCGGCPPRSTEETQGSAEGQKKFGCSIKSVEPVYIFRGDGNPKGKEVASRDMVFAVAEKRIAPSGEEWSCNSKSWKLLSALWPKDYLFRRLFVGVLRRISY